MSTPAALFPSLSGRVGQANLTFRQVVLRGLAGRCPNFGRGRMFGRFLKVTDACRACAEELFHPCADDFPVYLVIIGHIVVPLALVVETQYTPAQWLEMPVWLPLAAALAVGLIQPIKDAVVAIQWHGKLHGFGQNSEAGLPFGTSCATKGAAENDSIASAAGPPGVAA